MIHVIIPVHNRFDYTRSCIESLLKQITPEKLNIIVVNDGSTDNTKSYIENHYPQIKLLQGNGNLFWGGAVNYGINYARKISKKNDWVLLVNNDVEFAPNAISELIKVINNNGRRVIAGSLTLNYIDKSTVIKSGTIVESWFLNKTKHVYNGLDINKISTLKNLQVDFITGRCLLHPIEIFDSIGNYDHKNFLHYGADDEFSMRVKKYGYRTILCPSSIVFLKTYQEHKRNKISLSGLFFVLFNIKSSSNIFNKFKLTIKIVPFYAKISFFLIGVLKSLYIFFFKR